MRYGDDRDREDNKVLHFPRLNPKLVDPDKGFLTETGELVEVSHSWLSADGLHLGVTLSDGKYTGVRFDEVTFLTKKHDWSAK